MKSRANRNNLKMFHRGTPTKANGNPLPGQITGIAIAVIGDGLLHAIREIYLAQATSRAGMQRAPSP
ncbi:hypothetical protein B7R74_05290 [Yersinia pseudotuberculosis]|nr:hypothetical protein B7R74_05290 [Yersinia pseudotuberculosis]